MSVLLNPQGFGKRKGRKNLKQTSAYQSKEDQEAAEELSAAILAACLVVSFYLTSIIAYAYNYQQGWSVREAFYYGTVTMTTVGFGDFHPTHRDSQNFTIFFAIWGVCVIAVGLQEIAHFIEKRRQGLVNATKKRMIEASASPKAAQLLKEKEEKEKEEKRSHSFRGKLTAAIQSAAGIFDGGLTFIHHNHSHRSDPGSDHHHHNHHHHNNKHDDGVDVEPSPHMSLSPKPQTNTTTPPGSPSSSSLPSSPPSPPPRWLVILKSYGPLFEVFLRIVFYMFATGILFSYLEDWTIIDGLYYSVVTGCTVGYGDLYPETSLGMWLANLWLPGSVIFMGAELGKLGSLVFDTADGKDKLSSLMKADLSLEGLLAMDNDGDGEITEYEYLKYMLVACDIVDADVVESIHARFCKMDTDGSGSLTRDDLEEIVSQHDEPFGHHHTLKRKELAIKRSQLKSFMRTVPTRKIRLMETITEDTVRLAAQNTPLLERSQSHLSTINKTPKYRLPPSSSGTSVSGSFDSQSILKKHPTSLSIRIQNLKSPSSSSSSSSSLSGVSGSSL